MDFWYLATPYTNYPDGHQAAFEEAARQAVFLSRRSIRIFSPILHTHPMAVYGAIPGHSDNNIWDWMDAPFLFLAKGCIVCKMAGWQTSKGVWREMEKFKSLGKPIFFMKPNRRPEGFPENACAEGQ